MAEEKKVAATAEKPATEKKAPAKKAAAKPAAEKKPAVKKAPAKKADAPVAEKAAPAEKKAPAKKAAAKKATVKGIHIKLTKSLIGRSDKQIATAHALGLKKLGDVTAQPDNAATTGKINTISHMVEVTKA